MNQTVSSTASEAEVRAALDSWAKDVGTRDVKKIMAHYASDVLAFDAIGPLQFKGAEVYGNTGPHAWKCARARWYSRSIR